MMLDHYLLIFSTRKLRAKYNDTLQVNSSKELCTTFDCKGLKTGSVLLSTRADSGKGLTTVSAELLRSPLCLLSQLNELGQP